MWELIATILGARGFGVLVNAFQNMAYSGQTEDQRQLALDAYNQANEFAQQNYATVSQGIPYTPVGEAGTTPTQVGPAGTAKRPATVAAQQTPDLFPSAAELSAQGLEFGQQYYDPAAALARYQEQLAPTIAAYGERTEEAEATSADLLAQGQDITGLLGDVAQQSMLTGQDITGGYEKRLEQGLGILEGFGEQARLDVLQNWENQQAAQQELLAAQGLSGTIAAPALASAYQQGLSADLARLNEQQALLQYGAFTGLSGDVLGSQQYQQAFGAQQQTNLANALLGQQAFGAAQQGFLAGVSGEELGAQLGYGYGAVGAQDTAIGNYLQNLGYFTQLPYGIQQAAAAPVLNTLTSFQFQPPTQPAPIATY